MSFLESLSPRPSDDDVDVTVPPRSIPMRVLGRVASVGAVVVGVAVVGNVVGTSAPPPRSDYVVEAESPTRQFLDQRAAAHLRVLRRL